MRTSDCHCEPMPAACATPGMIEAFDGGTSLPPRLIGSRTSIATLIVSMTVPPEVTCSIATEVPTGIDLALAERTTSAGSVPDDGAAVTHGWSELIEKS